MSSQFNYHVSTSTPNRIIETTIEHSSEGVVVSKEKLTAYNLGLAVRRIVSKHLTDTYGDDVPFDRLAFEEEHKNWFYQVVTSDIPSDEPNAINIKKLKVRVADDVVCFRVTITKEPVSENSQLDKA